MRGRIVFLAGMSLYINLVACFYQQRECMFVRVELDAFSGRSNPEWNLTPQEAREFEVRLAVLMVDDAPQPLPDGLGFRGFRITGCPPYDAITIYHGSAELKRQGTGIRRLDPHRALEQFLLRTAERHVDAALYQVITSVVGG
jgi:hypothetical protein